MSRQDFISDKLVSMSERFRQNAAKTVVSAPALEKPVQSPEPEKEISEPPRLSAAIAIPGLGNFLGKQEELERIWRDLGGRLSRDIASTAAELEQHADQMRELEKFQLLLGQFREKFEAMGVPDAARAVEFGRAIDELRIEYFAAAGRVGAFLKGTAPSASPGAFEWAEKRFRDRLSEALPLGLFLLSGSILIAAVLLFLFA